MMNRGRIVRLGIAAATAVVMMAPIGARADVWKCQKDIDKAVGTLQSKLFGALAACKEAIRKEENAGALSGLGTTCGVGTCKLSLTSCRGNDECLGGTGDTCVINKTGAGCMPNAAKACEIALCKIYGIPGTSCKGTTSEVIKFRAAITKAFTTAGHCTTPDIAFNLTQNGTSLQHLLSGAGGMAPPVAGNTYDWLTDFTLFAIEKYTIKTQLMAVSDMFTLFQDAVAATPGPHGGAPALVAAAKGTSCATTNPNANQYDLRPNLCRFGVECRDHVCQLNDTGQDCSENGGAPCDASRGFCGNGFGRCSIDDPNGCPGGGDTTCYPECGGNCDPSQNLTGNGAYVQAQTFGSPPLNLAIPVFGSLAMEVCRAGRSQGVCQSNSSLPCAADSDCPPSDKCNLLPAEGAGQAFGTQSLATPTSQAPAFLYLINQPSRTIHANVSGTPLATFIKGVCVSVERSEGWCDCTGHGLPINFNTCQDHVTTTGAANDACGAAITDQNKEDEVYPGTIDGALTLNTALGGSVAGDCLDLVEVGFSALQSTADLGPDGKACTPDDFGTVSPPLAFPISTGTATAQLKDSPTTPGHCVKAGHCSGGANGPCNASLGAGACTGANTGTCNTDKCVQDINCAAVGGDTCSGAVLGNFTMTSTGARTTCANYLTSNLSGLGLSGAIPLAGLVPASYGIGDIAAKFHFGCK